jgi:hypothetical protein
MRTVRRIRLYMWTFKSVGGYTEDGILRSMKETIQKAYHDHEYLVNKDEKTWSRSDLKSEMGITCKVFIKYLRNPEVLSRENVIVGFKRLSRCLNVY